jgi:hypothetical protein
MAYNINNILGRAVSWVYSNASDVATIILTYDAVFNLSKGNFLHSEVQRWVQHYYCSITSIIGLIERKCWNPKPTWHCMVWTAEF